MLNHVIIQNEVFESVSDVPGLQEQGDLVMDQIEKDARGTHGFMYALTWRARETNQKWLWGVVLLVSLIQLIWLPTLVGALTWLLVSIKEMNFHNDAMALPFLTIVGFCALVSPFIHAFFDVKVAFRNTSQFISVAGDMNRLAGGATSRLTKVLSKLMFAFSGAVAICCALAIWIVYKNKLKSLRDTELDVLGNALANGKLFWKQALAIYHLMSARYTVSLQEKVPDMQIAVSFALACKWMLGDPNQDNDLRQWRKGTIAEILKTYERVLSPKVTIRLYEALGDKAKMAILREVMAAQYS